ncbi:unnamed protein product, partial [Musa textilis]
VLGSRHRRWRPLVPEAAVGFPMSLSEHLIPPNPPYALLIPAILLLQQHIRGASLHTMRSFLLIMFLMALTTSLAAADTHKGEQDRTTSFSDEASRILGRHRWRGSLSCKEHRNLCKLPRSPGPTCCGKLCVDLKTNLFNCGRCGVQCKFAEACCKGKCRIRFTMMRTAAGVGRSAAREAIADLGCAAM